MIATWIEATRPKTLIASISPVLIGSMLAFKAGSFSFLTFMFTLVTGLGIQIVTNLANDYFDFVKGGDTSKRIGPRRVVQADLVSIPSMKRAVFLTASFTALCSSYLTLQGGPLIGFLSMLSIFLGVGYTAGPWPLAYLGLGDIFVLLFFGPVATLGTFYLQTHVISPEVALLGFCPGLLSTAILTVNNLRDVEEDRVSRKKTLCVRFGETFCRVEYTVCLALACLIPCFFGFYLPLLTLIPAFVTLKAVWLAKDKQKLNVTLAQTGKLLLLFTILLIANHAF